MTAIRLISALGFALVASTAAEAGSPVAAASTGAIEAELPKLELGLSEVDYALENGAARIAPRTVGAEARDVARSRSLAHYLKAPAPYGRLLPQRIDDRGVGYRLWF
jgi:hypothetical protein